MRGWQPHVAACLALAALPALLLAHAPSIGLSRSNLNFTALPGGAPPGSQSVTLLNTTHGRMAWTASASTSRGGNWLSVNPSSGLLPGFNQFEWQALSISVSSTGSLAAGAYTGAITITAPGDALSPPADNSPQIIEVTLTIGTSGQPAPGIGLTPNALTIDVVAGSNGASIFQVRNTGGGTLNWTAAADAPWLSVSPPSGANTATVSVAARADNLPAGNYTGRIAVSASGAANTPQTLNVTLRVSAAPSPTLALAPAALSFTALVDGGNPPAQRLDISNAGSGALSWRATAVTFNGGQWLAVSPESGAAPSASNASVDLRSLAAGVYAGRVTVTADGAVNSPVQVPVTLTVTRPQPQVENRGVVHAATFLSGFLAPGQILTIFGANLGPREGVAFQFDPVTQKMPVSLAGVSVTFDGVPAPLYYVRYDQINLQVPFELAGKLAARMVVRVEGLDPVELSLPLREASPGIFTMPDGTRAAALNQDSTLNQPSNPAAPGSVVQLFLTGQGVVDPEVETGAAAPAQPPFPAPRLPVTVSMNGLEAPLRFAGLAPGFVGLLQVNAEVPRGIAASNDVNVVVLIGPHPAGRRATIAVR